MPRALPNAPRGGAGLCRKKGPGSEGRVLQDRGRRRTGVGIDGGGVRLGNLPEEHPARGAVRDAVGKRQGDGRQVTPRAP